MPGQSGPRALNVCALLAGVLLLTGATSAVAQELLAGPFLQQASPTGMWIVWESSEGEESRVDFGVSEGLGQSATGESLPNGGDARIHQTELTGLSPATRYYYRVVTGTAHSEIAHFKTPALASAEQSVRFVAYSDSQTSTHLRKHEEIVNEGILGFIADEWGGDLTDELDFVLVPGDLVSEGRSLLEWRKQFFAETSNLFPFVPVYPVTGNHEDDDPNYFRYFRLPENGTPGFLEHWYYFDHGNIRVIGLDSNTGYRIQEQLDWLDSVLADAAANDDLDFVFVQLHHPFLSELWSSGNLDYTGDVIARMEQFTETTGKASVHFFGHTHGYSRGQSRDHQHLWINVAAAEGNIDYWGATAPVDYEQFQRSFPEWGFTMVEVEGGADPSMRIRRVSRGNDLLNLDNMIRDDLALRVSNQAPATPLAETPSGPGGAVAPEAVTLEASAFSDPDGDGHLESHFQLTTTAGDYAAPVRDEWIRFENLFAPEGADGLLTGFRSVDTVAGRDITRLELGALAPSTNYHWRVRYRDLGFEWSGWSAEQSFTTGAAQPCNDADGDGYGDPASALCDFPELDCDDSDAAVNPGAVELPGNGVDENCDGMTPVCGSATAMASVGPSGAGGIGLPSDLALFGIPAFLGVLALRRRR